MSDNMTHHMSEATHVWRLFFFWTNKCKIKVRFSFSMKMDFNIFSAALNKIAVISFVLLKASNPKLSFGVRKKKS